nr:uncharacterized protein LOC112012624 isoform X3 [Quercus suber]POE50330.1 hypothetical protein CFP56_60348 [Quercus suber]
MEWDSSRFIFHLLFSFSSTSSTSGGRRRGRVNEKRNRRSPIPSRSHDYKDEIRVSERLQVEFGSPTSVIPDLFFSSREQQQQIGSPFTPINAPKITNPHLSISADRFQFRVPSTTDDDVVLQNLLHIIHYIINKKKSSSSSLTPAQKLFNSLDLVQKKVTQQLERIKETPTFQIGDKLWGPK